MGTMLPEILRGRIQSGKGDAARWLSRFNEAYARKTGMPVFPGSLNVLLDEEFDWFAPRRRPHVVMFQREEYGGERDVLLLPCVLTGLGSLQGFLWSTTRAALNPLERRLVEVIAPVGIKATYGVKDGDPIEIELSI